MSPDRSDAVPSVALTRWTCDCSSSIGSAPVFRTSARSFASRSVNCPVMRAFPSVIASWTVGADSTRSSRTIASCFCCAASRVGEVRPLLRALARHLEVDLPAACRPRCRTAHRASAMSVPMTSAGPSLYQMSSSAAGNATSLSTGSSVGQLVALLLQLLRDELVELVGSVLQPFLASRGLRPRTARRCRAPPGSAAAPSVPISSSARSGSLMPGQLDDDVVGRPIGRCPAPARRASRRGSG